MTILSLHQHPRLSFREARLVWFEAPNQQEQPESQKPPEASEQQKTPEQIAKEGMEKRRAQAQEKVKQLQDDVTRLQTELGVLRQSAGVKPEHLKPKEEELAARQAELVRAEKELQEPSAEPEPSIKTNGDKYMHDIKSAMKEFQEAAKPGPDGKVDITKLIGASIGVLGAVGAAFQGFGKWNETYAADAGQTEKGSEAPAGKQKVMELLKAGKGPDGKDLTGEKGHKELSTVYDAEIKTAGDKVPAENDKLTDLKKEELTAQDELKAAEKELNDLKPDADKTAAQGKVTAAKSKLEQVQTAVKAQTEIVQQLETRKKELQDQQAELKKLVESGQKNAKELEATLKNQLSVYEALTINDLPDGSEKSGITAIVTMLKTNTIEITSRLDGLRFGSGVQEADVQALLKAAIGLKIVDVNQGHRGLGLDLRDGKYVIDQPAQLIETLQKFATKAQDLKQNEKKS